MKLFKIKVKLSQNVIFKENKIHIFVVEPTNIFHVNFHVSFHVSFYVSFHVSFHVPQCCMKAFYLDLDCAQCGAETVNISQLISHGKRKDGKTECQMFVVRSVVSSVSYTV